MRRAAAAVLLLAALALGACAELSYYGQAIGGHFAVMRAARPIDDLVADPGTEPGLRARLQQVGKIRDFASR